MIMNLYRNIDRETIQFDFVIHTSEKQAYYEEILALGGRIYHFPAFDGKNLFLLKKLWDGFFKGHPEYKILHSHVRSYASIYFRIAKKHGLKLIIHSHSTSNGKGLISAVKHVLQLPLRFQADFLMACSTESGKWLYGKNACKKPNYRFVPNGIDIDQYAYSETIAAEYRESLGLKDKFVLGHVGRFHEAKNHVFLLDIFAGICERRPDAMLLLVGDGDIREKIESKIRSLGLENRVVITGSRSDVPNLLQAMDVFVFPSLWEGLPVTVVEAQVAGLPCLISDRITNDVDISESVKRLPIENPTVWMDAILSVDTSRKDVRDKIKSAGFDVRDVARVLKNFYIDLVKEPSK
jgi:glycosyltransferase involved in cell wall biosynthesis